MSLYERLPLIVEAAQWFKNGDHPHDYADVGIGDIVTTLEGRVVRYFRHPRVSGDQICGLCEQRMHDHGFIDNPIKGRIVCPGDFVITDPVNPGTYYSVEQASFHKLYRLKES